MSSFYLASRMSRRLELQTYAARLRELGFECTSTWLNGDERGLSDAEIAILDLNDVRRAEQFALFTDGGGAKGACRHCEWGYALGLGRRVHVVGPAENEFHAHPDVVRHDSVLDWLGSLGRRRH